MNEYSFQEKLNRSKGVCASNDMNVLQRMIDGCKEVYPTGTVQDKMGVDYVAVLRGGARLYVDAKNRERGCSKYWNSGPELALELWSVRPGGKYNTRRSQAKTGWTLCETKDVDLILFTFDPTDCATAFLFSYQHLRIAFRRNYKNWNDKYKTDIQSSKDRGRRWQSECIFVSVCTVEKAIRNVRREALRI